MEDEKGSGKFRILLVDDEKDFVDTLSQRMQMRDLSADVALNGEEALELLNRESPDVMVLDLRMPGVDGMEVLKRVKNEHPNVQVIMLTGQGTEKDELEARRLGAFDYLEKPVDIETLVSRIRSGVLLVVGNEDTFSNRLINYALEMAQRMSYRLVALSIAPVPETALKRLSMSEGVKEFEERARQNAQEFARAAEEHGIPFEHIVRYGEYDAVIEQAAKEYGNVEFVVSEPTDKGVAEASKEDGSEKQLYVYSVA
ncbi:MAG: response regulator [Desulfobacteraceae bacterium]|nr:response regulator [Desulfobacteraceae bacterium]MCF8094075.1 response regulator [Desulfobacteraceae bacterium]